MCGIFGAVSSVNIHQDLIKGLSKLEYRGYDSAGLSLITNSNRIKRIRCMGKVNALNKLSLFQKNDAKFMRKCPFSKKDAPEIDYKNVKLLKRYVSENSKILSSKITAVSNGKQRKLTKEIKKAKILGLI